MPSSPCASVYSTGENERAGPPLTSSPTPRRRPTPTIREVPRMAAPTIVLVHGAFADASGFRVRYDELLDEDVTILAPPNSLRGLTGGDGEYLESVIAEIEGPVLLV